MKNYLYTLTAGLMAICSPALAKDSEYGDFPRFKNEASAVLQQAGTPEQFRAERTNGARVWYDGIYLPWWSGRALTRTRELDKLYFGSIDEEPWVQDWFTNEDGSIVCIWAQGGNYFVNRIFVFRRDEAGVYRRICLFTFASGGLPLAPEETKFCKDGLILSIGNPDSLMLRKKFSFENKEESCYYLFSHDESSRSLPAPIKRKEPDTLQQGLFLAAQLGQPDKAKELLQQGAAARATDSIGRTPLHWAVQEGYADIVRLLLDSGADVNAQDADKRTPVIQSILSGQYDCLRELLKHKPDLELADACPLDQRRRTALQYACGAGFNSTASEEAARMLLAAGASANGRGADGSYTPLMDASMNGHASLVRLLLESGADPRAERNGKTALDYARSSDRSGSHRQVISLLEQPQAKSPK